jgi:hypothetical protein
MTCTERRLCRRPARRRRRTERPISRLVVLCGPRGGRGVPGSGPRCRDRGGRSVEVGDVDRDDRTGRRRLRGLAEDVLALLVVRGVHPHVVLLEITAVLRGEPRDLAVDARGRVDDLDVALRARRALPQLRPLRRDRGVHPCRGSHDREDPQRENSTRCTRERPRVPDRASNIPACRQQPASLIAGSGCISMC